jgi:hypothetical protein
MRQRDAERLGMGRRDDDLKHYGPEPHFGIGPEAVHHQVHHKAIGQTIEAVYLGDNERFRSIDSENSPPDGIFRSEYLAFEFTDGTALVLQVASGNSFHVAAGDEAEKVLKRAHQAALQRASTQGHIKAKLPEHESEGQALTEASQTSE